MSTAEEIQQSFKDLQAEMSEVVLVKSRYSRKYCLVYCAADTCCLKRVPGLAKTLMVETLSTCVQAEYSRIHLHRICSLVMSRGLRSSIRKRSFSVRPGPVFANIVLADEINRAPAKVQAALLEAMQEKAGHSWGSNPSAAAAFLGARNAKPH